MRAIAESKLPQAEAVLQAIVGDEVLSLLRRFQETQELRPLPAHLLPEPSRNFVRTSHWRKTPLRSCCKIQNPSGEGGFLLPPIGASSGYLSNKISEDLL